MHTRPFSQPFDGVAFNAISNRRKSLTSKKKDATTTNGEKSASAAAEEVASAMTPIMRWLHVNKHSTSFQLTNDG